MKESMKRIKEKNQAIRKRLLNYSFYMFSFMLFFAFALSGSILADPLDLDSGPATSIEAETESMSGVEVNNSYSSVIHDSLRDELNLLWMILAAFLVFLMQAGFAYVESGFTRAKNAVNILMKNLTDVSVGGIAFWLIGFSIMFGPHLFKGLGFGFPSTASGMLDIDSKPDPWSYGFLLFQMVFCATAATIASGAMAERTRFIGYIIYSVLISAIVYPVFGSMAWSDLFIGGNEGFLVKLGFIDFAGSTVVHSVGAWLGLAGTMVLGPRIGKYRNDGTVYPIFGHNMAMATMGVFLLWFGWFGFNAGSTTEVDGGSFAIIALVTNMAAVAGAVGAMLISWLLFRRPDISMVLNGVLAGLVAITAGCYNVNIGAALIIGFIAGVLIVFTVIMLDYFRIDDPVGAVSVHGFAGAWGTIAVGIFANPDFGDGAAGLLYGGGFSLLGVQALGVLIAFVWAFGAGYILFLLIHKIIGLRVSEEEEIEGLDILEHGNQAYPEHNL